MTKPKDIITRPQNMGKNRGKGRPFEPGCKPGPGRKRGGRDHMATELRQALLMAISNVGEMYAAENAAERKEKGLPVNRNANRGMAAYLERIAHTHPSVMGALLSRILPSKVEGEHTVQHTAVAYTSYEEIANRLRELGLEPRRIYAKKPEPDKVS
jgi:hypothetical protein